jgi:hypothetical protein
MRKKDGKRLIWIGCVLAPVDAVIEFERDI